MKKLALSMILGASLMVTSSAFALTSMTDSNMKSATGQAGVTIAVDNILIETYTGTTKYIDEDGTDGVAGALVISEKHVVKEFLGLVSNADFQADFLAATGQAALATWKPFTGTGPNGGGAHGLSIDVGKCDTISAGMSDNMGGAVTIAGVIIGLPTLLIKTSADSYNVGIEMAGAANTGKNFIRVEKGASAMAILGGVVEIAPH